MVDDGHNKGTSEIKVKEDEICLCIVMMVVPQYFSYSYYMQCGIPMVMGVTTKLKLYERHCPHASVIKQMRFTISYIMGS